MNTDMTGPLWLLYGGSFLLEKNVIELLRQVEQRGSITNAAKAAGISYKTTWDLIDRLNNVSSSPQVVTRTGSKHGGGCDLSDYGKKSLEFYDQTRVNYNKTEKWIFGYYTDFQIKIPWHYPCTIIMQRRLFPNHRCLCGQYAIRNGTN